MSDTPRTDKACDYTAPEKLHRLCGELELENAQLREALKKCKTCDIPEYILDLVKDALKK